MKRLTALLLLFTCSMLALSFSNAPKEKVKWISFEEMEKLYAQQPKPIIIDLYTDWCGWCREMDRTTYSNSKVASYINEHYYAVKYNAESTDSIWFNKVKYGFNHAMKTNELALSLSFGDRSYPNTIFLETIDARPAPLSGYMKPKEMEGPLRYFVEKKEDETFVEFHQKMKKGW
ncbi:MAG: DUF255 domain-containing protein [Ferruginibacter sp.]